MNIDPLLYPVFDYLRRHGVPIGVSEYQVAVQTVREGVMADDYDALKRLCRLLWAKSEQDLELVEVAFALLLEPAWKPGVAASSMPNPVVTPPGQRPRPPSLTESSIPEPTDGESKLARPPVRTTAASGFRTTPLRAPEVAAANVSTRPYQLTPRFPLGQREMTTAWRHLRRLQRSGPAIELDVPATLDAVCRNGVFMAPILRPRRSNQVRLLLLIDRQGSMTPFAPLVELLINSILRGGLLGRVTSFYFHDCPDGFLYSHPAMTRPQPLAETLAAHAKDAGVLIVSDAGAARGYYDGQRVEQTQIFLRALQTYTYTYAWLNPLPAYRWSTTTAESVACMTPMFAIDWEGLNDTVSILQGRPARPGVSIDAI